MTSHPVRAESPVGGLGFVWLGAVSMLGQTLLVRETLFAFHGGEIGLGLFYALWVAGIAGGAALGVGWCRPPAARVWTPIARPLRASTPIARLLRARPPRAHPVVFEGILIALVLLEILALFVMRHHRLWIDVPSGGYLPAPTYVVLLLVTVVPAGGLTGFAFPVGLSRGRVSAGGAYALESLGSMAGGAAAALYLLPRVGSLTSLWMAGLVVLLWVFARRIRAFFRHGHVCEGGPDGPRPAASSPRERPAESTPWERPVAGPHRPRPVAGPQRPRPVAGPHRLGLVVQLLVAALSLVGAAAWLFSGGPQQIEDRWLAARWRGLSTGSEPILQVDTPYHHLTVATLGGERGLYLNGMYQGNLQDAYVDSVTAALVAGQHPRPSRLYAIAPAFYGPLTVLAGAEDVQVTVLRLDEQLDRALARAAEHAVDLEVDPAIDRVADRALDPTRDLVVRLRTGDPRNLLRHAHPRPDLIWVTGGGPTTAVGNRFYTVDFFELCARSLAPGGALVLSLAGAANVPSPEEARLRASIFASLTEVFRDVRALPGENQLLMAALPRGDVAGAATTLQRSPLTTRPDSLGERRARNWPSGRFWPEAYFARLLPRERVEGLEAALANEARTARLNTDRVPGVFFEQLRRWDRLAGGHLAPLLTVWRAHPWRGGLLLLLGMMALLAIIRRGAGQPAVTILSTGLSGMGWSLLVLLLYQTQRGALYLKVGLVTGLFMLGLALGAWAGERLARRIAGQSRQGLLGMDLAWVVFLAVALLMLPGLTDVSPSVLEAGLLLAAATGGILTGLPFPLATLSWWRRTGDPANGGLSRRGHRVAGSDTADAATAAEKVAEAGGAASAADHGGAIVGALLTGSLLVPLLGFSGTLVFLGLVKATSALSAVLPGRRL